MTNPLFFGRELAADPGLGVYERLYIRLLGAPVQGLRVRARWLLPRLPAPRVVTPRAGEKILDAGCGRAAFSLHLARTRPGARIIAIDMDEDRLLRARGAAKRLNLANLFFVRGDLLHPPFRAAFDWALCVDVIEDFPDPGLALAALRTVLVPGGGLFGHAPARTRRWLLFRWRENFDAPGHARPGFEPGDIRAALAEAGYEDSEVRYTYGILETFANNLSYLITGAREKRKFLYALVFPLLLLLTLAGRAEDPARGAGLFFRARRP